MNPVKQWAIAIHAGAGTISRNIDSKPREDGLKAALDAGQNALFENSYCSFWSGSGLKTPSLPFLSALAAVEFLEACPLFNAGIVALNPLAHYIRYLTRKLLFRRMWLCSQRRRQM